MWCVCHLKSKLVLLRITKSPHLVNNILEVVLDEVHRLAEPASDGLPGVVLRLVAVVVADAQLQGDVRPQSRILHWFHLLLMCWQSAIVSSLNLAILSRICTDIKRAEIER